MSTTSPALDRRDAIDAFAAILMVGLTFAWGFNQVAVKVSTYGYSPVFLTCMRSAIGALLVFAWCRYRGIPLFERDGTLVPGVIAGLLFGSEFALVFLGLDLTTVARGTLMLNTMPFWVLVAGHFFLGERVTPAKLGGLALAFAGVVLVFSDELSLPDPAALRGDILCLVAGMLWGATIIVIKATKLGPARAEKTLLYQLVISAIMSVPLLPLGGPILRDVSALATGALAFQAIFIVAFTYLLFFWLMRRYPASGISSFVFLSPVFGVVCGGLLLGEPLSLRIALALVLIAIGLLVVNRPPRRGAAPA